MFKSKEKRAKEDGPIPTDKHGIIPWHKRKHMLDNEYSVDDVGVPLYQDCCKDI
jgi:hypothetical protein